MNRPVEEIGDAHVIASLILDAMRCAGLTDEEFFVLMMNFIGYSLSEISRLLVRECKDKDSADRGAVTEGEADRAEDGAAGGGEHTTIIEGKSRQYTQAVRRRALLKVADWLKKNHDIEIATTVSMPVHRKPGSNRKRLNEEAVLAIRQKYAAGVQPLQLSLEYGVSTETIHNVVRRRTWRHVA